uniref:chorismate mutase n=1 Tax=Globisporangium ultimum (strain ATCC 200006 / CBS 805.95 / DAOM BR144) TaxID=431595 RepID=K3X8Z2_GLOUD
MQSSHDLVFADPRKPVKLADFRNVLIRQEETIIFALIERAQFPHNAEVYIKRNQSGSVAFGGLKGKYDSFDGSFLDFMFSETEKLHALARRYTSPDENAFYPHLLPEPILPSLQYPQVLKPNRININDQIMSIYLDKILPGMTEATSDHTSFGSTASADIAVLQALSKRMHFGKFIAEAKFQAETERYSQLILANDAAGIMEALTNMAVEEKVLERVKLKASTYGQDLEGSAPSSSSTEWKVDPQLISDIYRDFVMPLTKEVQVAYLLQRLAHPTISVAGVEGSFCWIAAQAHFGGETLAKEHFVETESISKVFNDVSANRTAYGVVPIEDSKLGMIKVTQALLLRNSLKVSAEIVLTKSFVFAAKDKHKVKTGDVSKVFLPGDMDARLHAHIEQCWPSAQVVPVANVTESAQRASQDDTSIAVTTSGAAAARGLEQLDGGNALATATWKPVAPGNSATTHSTDTSFIRFVVISQDFPASTGQDKSLLTMDIKHEVGSLLSALEIWKNHSINMSCLESIYRQDSGGYDFFVEIVGHVNDANVKAAIAKLQSEICVVKHLGSFPIAKREILS